MILQSVAILIDGNNIERSLHELSDDPGAMLNFNIAIPRLLGNRALNRLIYFREGKQISSKLAERLHSLYHGSVVPCHKNADIPLSIKAMQLSSKVDTIIIFSGDSDYIELVRHLKAEGVRVEIAAVLETTSGMLKEECDYYHPLQSEDIFSLKSRHQVNHHSSQQHHHKKPHQQNHHQHKASQQTEATTTSAATSPATPTAPITPAARGPNSPTHNQEEQVSNSAPQTTEEKQAYQAHQKAKAESRRTQRNQESQKRRRRKTADEQNEEIQETSQSKDADNKILSTAPKTEAQDNKKNSPASKVTKTAKKVAKTSTRRRSNSEEK